MRHGRSFNIPPLGVALGGGLSFARPIARPADYVDFCTRKCTRNLNTLRAATVIMLYLSGFESPLGHQNDTTV
ncbi:exported hypothetical protein [uncultured Eubacteriales bacterium]|uniref:Uncharacterized protein n=1 Tax=uncultured Eubacteriales bacterium TaxID=172733 RepID=A0A212J5R8_9FIRM|nr:exported hypothetical protein [uncultured Eubacteriales bacterium]